MYADNVTKSMQATIDETNRRRKIQKEYNKKYNIKPRSVNKTKENILAQTTVAKTSEDFLSGFDSKIELDPIINNMIPEEIEKIIKVTERKMKKAATINITFQKPCIDFICFGIIIYSHVIPPKYILAILYFLDKLIFFQYIDQKLF